MEIENQPEQMKRPMLLTVLSIFSFIAIGFGLLGALLGLISGPASSDQVDEVITQNMGNVNKLYEMGEMYWADTTAKILNFISYTNTNFYADKLLNLLAYGSGLMGVLWMRKGRKLGFHLYICYNIVALLSVYASVPVAEVPSFYIIFFGIISAIFVFLYSRTLKFMH
jgi:hypothetical protein